MDNYEGINEVLKFAGLASLLLTTIFRKDWQMEFWKRNGNLARIGDKDYHLYNQLHRLAKEKRKIPPGN